MRRNYSKVIEEMRTIHGLNLVAIGQQIGIDPRTVGKWAKGKNKPNQESRKRLNRLYREVRQNMTTQNKESLTTGLGNVVAVDSRTVAEWTGKEHKILMRDIRQYSEYLKGTDLCLTDFWVESTYKASNGKTQPCYMVTKKGCEFIQHKMTGQKGAVFTAKYINFFWEMGEQLQEATEILLDLSEKPQPTLPPPTNLAEAEQNYINALAQSIIETDSMDEKKELADRLTSLMQEVVK